jgi:DNA gyrase/topoisomerase IV subunit B
MDEMEGRIKTYFVQNEPLLLELLERFQRYRSAIQSKSMTKFSARNKSRFSTKFTKLRDCSKPLGELIIGEGDSAVGGLVQFRDPKKHAILPLRGVIPNALTMNRKKLLDNAEVKDIVQALGTGIDAQCDITKLRYSKIIIATDADPAGHWIASLLIILFATLTPDLIKNGHLFVCRTPLFGTVRKKQFVPLWKKEDVDKARGNGEKVNRYKGLGEFKPRDLTVFTLEDQSRILLPIEWSERYDQVFDLFTSSAQKRKLIAGEWKLKDVANV